jgi:hypothetical protein
MIMLDVSSAGVVSISGLIRNLYTITAPPSAVSYTTISSAGNSTQTSDTESGTGTSLYGNTTYFPFNSNIVPGTTSLAIEDVSYRMDDTIFVLPAQSTVTRATKVFQIKAAALTTFTGSMTAVLYVPITQALTITKKIVNTTVPMTAYGTAGDFTLYTSDNVAVSNAVSVVVKVLLGYLASKTVISKIFVGGF